MLGSMSSSSLSAAFGQLRLADNPLIEGKPELLGFDFTPELQTHFKQVISYAYLKWGMHTLENQVPLAQALKYFNIRLGQYFRDPNALAAGHDELAPKELIHQICSQLTAILERVILDKTLMAQITSDPTQRKCLADLCLLQAFFVHEDVVNHCLSEKIESSVSIQKKILLARSAFKRIDTYPIEYANKALEEQLIGLKRSLLQHIYILETLYIPDALGYKELQFHIDRKNALAKLKQNNYYAELIFNRDAYQQHAVDQTVVQTLIEGIKRIKNEEQPRTQFIVDVLGIGHAMVVDVALNNQTSTLDIMCIEPACLGFQADFLTQLLNGLTIQGIPNTRTIAIQAGLLKDYHSCYTLSLALSSELAKCSFDRLLSRKEVPQPTFLRGHESGAEPRLAKVSWRDITVLGKKVVMMAQSFTDMRANLLKMFPTQAEKLDDMIKDLKLNYGLGERFESLGNATHERSYSHIKRAALRQKTTSDPFSDLSVPIVLAKNGSKTVEQTLRLLAAGAGPCRDMQFLLQAHPEVIDQVGVASGRTALHFAYDKGKLGRAYYLEKAGADQTIQDKQLQKPKDLRKH